MLFSIKNTYKLSIELLKIRVFARARQSIFLYPYGETELELNKYLLEAHGITLRTACLQILFNGKFFTDEAGDLIFLIQNQYWDKLASIITYGPDGKCGSKILKEALKN